MRRFQGYSFQFYFLVAAAILIAPLIIGGIFAAASHVSSERKELEHAAEDAVRVAAEAFDAETQIYRATFRALIASPDAFSLRAAELQDRAQALLSQRRSDLVLDIVPLVAPAGESEEAGTSEAQGAAIHTTLVVDRTGKATFTLSSDPYRRSGTIVMLRMQLILERFSQRLGNLIARGDFVVSIYDSNGDLMTMSGANPVLLPADVDHILASSAERGRLASVEPEGDYVTFWQKMPDIDRYIAVSVDLRFSHLFLTYSFAVLLLITLLPLLGGVLSAVFLARVLSTSQHELLAAASAVGDGRRIQPVQTGLIEANVIGQALVDASIQIENGARALKLANDELEERIRERTHELHQKGQLIEDTLNSLDQGIIHFDKQGRIILLNRPAGTMLEEQGLENLTLGETVAASRRAPSLELTPHSLSDAAKLPLVVERHLPNGVVLEICKTTLLNGSSIWSLSDVSNRVRQADELRQARVLAEAANQAKDDFLANMSHELRTPLNAVLGYADLLMLDPSLSAANEERVRRLRGAGWGLLTLVNDILDFARSATGELSIKSVSFDIGEVARDAFSIAQSLASEKSLAFDLDVDDALPCLMGDPDRVRQILINLLSNAVKFTEVGFVRLSLRKLDREVENKLMLHMCVEDSGIGIPFDRQDAVFDRFYQVEHKNDAMNQGAGLGLAICRQLATQMGGKIWLRSSPEVGTLFTVALEFPVDLHEQDTSSEPTTGKRTSCRILVADDVEIGRDVAAQLLQAAGAEVDCVSDGLQAVGKAAGCSYDLIVLDLRMPNMDGLEAARLIRTDPATRHVPIVICSASPPTDDMDASGCYDGFLAKPLDARSVGSMLDRHLATHPRMPGPGRMHHASPANNEMDALAKLVGRSRVEAGLAVLESQLDELARLDLTRRESAVRISEIAHAALTSARLLGFEELFLLLSRLDDGSLAGDDLLLATGTMQPALGRIRREVTSRRREWAPELTS